MNLYGTDMDETVSPLESALAWTVAMKDERAFVGKDALLKQKADGVEKKLVGLVLQGRGVLRPGQRIVTAAGEGVTTSGSFAPTLQRSIRLRNPYVDPMSLLQVDLLKRWRAVQCQDEALLEALLITVNGIARGIQNTG